MSRAPDTPARLIAAAEALYFERGVESVSLREIGRAAEAKNVLAVQYWFKDRDGLVRAILDKHQGDVDTRRHTILDLYQAQGRDDLRGLAEALVRPLASKLDQGTSGAGYLRVMSDLLTGPKPSAEPWGADTPANSTTRWSRMLEPHLDPEAVALHRRFHTLRFVVTELVQRARTTNRTDNRLFVSQLIDAVVGLLGADVSDETRAIHESLRRTS